MSDAQKPLASVWKIAEFGPTDEDKCTANVGTKNKIQMIRKGGSYVIAADYVTLAPSFGGQAMMQA